MPNDREFEYLVTQVIADFLSAQVTPIIDGIIYPSAQNTLDSSNVVLFYKASKVKKTALPPGNKINASLGEFDDQGLWVNYSVIEMLSNENKKPQKKNSMPKPDFNRRKDTLQIELSSLCVHHVKGIRMETDQFEVSRVKWQEEDIGSRRVQSW